VALGEENTSLRPVIIHRIDLLTHNVAAQVTGVGIDP
jgi:hypothetical protein